MREQAVTAEQLFKATDAALQRTMSGPRPEQIGQAEARYQLQQEQVRLIEDRLKKFVITAPFDGFVSAERTQMGEWLQQGDPVAEIIQLSELKIEAPVPADQAVQLSPGASVRVEFAELPGDVFTGTVDRVIPAANLATRTFPVIVRLENRIENGRPLMMSGMLARLELPTGARGEMPLVPKDAVVLNGSRRSVFVVDVNTAMPETGTVRALPVSLGIAEGTLVQVEAPLKANDLVVVRGNERLKDGQAVSFQMLHPAPGALP